MHSPIFAFDFSTIKPAMVSLINNELRFFVWPARIDNKTLGALTDCGVRVTDRNLDIITKKTLEESELICEHVHRADCLAKMIVSDMMNTLAEYDIHDPSNVIVANEGFAFSAKGNAVLELAGYKYILMKALADAGFKNLRTYTPTSIKAVAGCGRKGMGSKENMINAIAHEKHTEIHTFCDIIAHNPQLLKKKTAYMCCVDDLADAYWCLKTAIKKEEIICILSDE